MEGEAVGAHLGELLDGVHHVEGLAGRAAERVGAVVADGPETERELVGGRGGGHDAPLRMVGELLLITTYTIRMPRPPVSDPIARPPGLLSVATYTACVSRTDSRPLRRVTPQSRMNETVGSRQANLARLLRLAHLEGPVSRATLTAATGLNRSTIADLVGDLVALGVVEERAPDPSRRVGRPSPLVSGHPRVMAIAVNPEVDALTMSAVGLDRTVRRRERIEMAGLIGPERTAQLIAERIAEWRADELADAADRRDRRRGAGSRARVGRARAGCPAPAVDRRRAARADRGRRRGSPRSWATTPRWACSRSISSAPHTASMTSST